MIAIKPQPGNQGVSVDGLLKDWGSRMWTLPEALLAPKDKPIQIYNARHGNPEFVKQLPKKDLATLVWSDTSELSLPHTDHVAIALFIIPTVSLSVYTNKDSQALRVNSSTIMKVISL